MAKSAHMYFFVPLRKHADGEFSNPSLEVAKRFNITPSQLPGIVLFTRKTELLRDDFLPEGAGDSSLPITELRNEVAQDDLNVSHGIYFPLKTSLFDQDFQHVEEVLRDLFTIIQECQRETQSPQEMMNVLQKKVRTLAKKQAMRPAITYMGSAFVSLLTFSASLVGEVLRTTLMAKGEGFLVFG